MHLVQRKYIKLCSFNLANLFSRARTLPCYNFIDRFSAGVPRELDERQVPEHPVLHSSAASRLQADPRLDESYQGSSRLSRIIPFGDSTNLGRLFSFAWVRLDLTKVN